jgi:hypothetical protein
LDEILCLRAPVRASHATNDNAKKRNLASPLFPTTTTPSYILSTMSTNHISNHNSKRGYGDMDNRRIGCGQGSWDQQDDGDTTKMMEDQREQFQQPDDAEGDGNGPTGYNTPPRYFEGDIEHDDDGGGGGDDEDYLDGESGHMYHDDSYQFQRADSGEFVREGNLFPAVSMAAFCNTLILFLIVIALSLTNTSTRTAST